MFQKLFSILFTYIIGFQLMVGVIPQHALSTSAWANECSSGLQWNDLLGRCVTTAQAAQLADASKMCESKGDEAAKRQCYRDVIDGKIKDEGLAGPGKVSASTMSIMLAMASLIASVMFLTMGGGDCPGATSAYIMAGSAVAVVAGEILSASKYKSAVKKAEEKFKAVTDSSKKDSDSKSTSFTSDNKSATSAQAEAFQAMIEMEEATISAAKTKNMLYMVATAGYAAATVMTGLETIRYLNPTPVGMADKIALECRAATVSYSSERINDDALYAATNLAPQLPSLTEVYIDNYFQKNQRVSFNAYRNFSLINQTEDSIELAIANQELIELRTGSSASSLTAEQYSSSKFWKKEIMGTESKEEFQLMKAASIIAQQFMIPEASAQAPVVPVPITGTLIGGTFTAGTTTVGQLASAGGTLTQGSSTMTITAGSGLKKLFFNPMTRMALAGVMTINNIFMIKKTNSEKKKAEERKAFIEKLKAQVEAAGTEFGCANNDRNDLSKPNCYCYSEGGGLNPGRVNSATCKNLFGAKPTLAAGKTGNPTDVSNQRNCVSASGALDSSCSCRTSNTCLTVKSPTLVGNVPAGNVFGNLPQTINGLNNGTLSPADINGAQLSGLAARLQNINEKLINDPKNKALALEARKAKALGEKTIRDAERGLAASGAGLLASSAGGSGLLNASSPAAALEALKNEVSQQIKGYEGNVVPVAGGTAARKTDDFSLDALNGGGGVTVADEQLADAMNTQYDMGNSDINTDSGASIFNILSSRYQRSGMRRLFGSETVVPVQAPAPSNISK